MGMQQILLIVLSVIIVGVAVAVGITMFGTQAVNANRSAIAGDLNIFAASALAYYKTPSSMGGGERSFTSSTANLYKWLGFEADGKDSNANGSYSLVYGTVPAEHVIYITGLGTEKFDATHNVGAQIVLTATDLDPIDFTIKDDIGTSL